MKIEQATEFLNLGATVFYLFLFCFLLKASLFLCGFYVSLFLNYSFTGILKQIQQNHGYYEISLCSSRFSLPAQLK